MASDCRIWQPGVLPSKTEFLEIPKCIVCDAMPGGVIVCACLLISPSVHQQRETLIALQNYALLYGRMLVLHQSRAMLMLVWRGLVHVLTLVAFIQLYFWRALCACCRKQLLMSSIFKSLHQCHTSGLFFLEQRLSMQGLKLMAKSTSALTQKTFYCFALTHLGWSLGMWSSMCHPTFILQIMTLLQVRAAAFLHKYSAPTLLVLFESEPTWAGRLRDKKDTMNVAAISVASSEQQLAEIWEAGELPSDAFCLLPVASGGALVLCRHLIIFQAQVCQLAGCLKCTFSSDIGSYTPMHASNLLRPHGLTL